jgi:hypothetical protein
MIVAVLLLAAGAAVLLVFEQGQVADARAAHADVMKKKVAHDAVVAAKKAQDEADAQAAAAAAEDARLKSAADDAARAIGFTPSPTADGVVFYKGFDADCSTTLSCAWITVAVARSCPSGVYIAANLETADGVVVSYGNDITGALDPQHVSAVELRFPSGGGSDLKYRVTDAHCL